ncbi:MAG: homoserine kinase [Acidobacteriota bacterium]
MFCGKAALIRQDFKQQFFNVMTQASTRIRVPSSTSNLGSGFDSLGLALQFYLTLDVEPAEEMTFTFSGEGAAELNASTEDNLIFQAMKFIAAREGVELRPARFHVTNEIPLARGLGSSAAAIIAGFSAFEVVTGVQLSQQKLMDYATEMEHHSDNVTAALLGAFVVSSVDERGKVFAAKVDFPEAVRAIVVIPNFKVRTEEARRVVPLNLSREDAVFNIQRAAMFVASVAARRYDLFREAMRDRLHQPYRAPLVPGLAEILNLENVEGLLGVALSGSGPTVFALANDDFEGVKQALVAVFASRGIECKAHIVAVDTTGRVITRS